MILTRLEKEQLVLDLHNQGKGTAKITREVKISFSQIGAILKRATHRERLDKYKQKEHLFQHKHTNSFPKDGQRFK